MSCRCEKPREAVDPRRAGSCLKCGRRIGTAEDHAEEIALISGFYHRVAVGAFPADRSKPGLPPVIPEDYDAFTRQAALRHLDGIQKFGDRWKARDNLKEAREEASDWLNYAAFDVLQHGGIDGDPEIALALEEARYLFMAYRCNRARAAKRRGAP